ncbi:MAG: PKD domain-containing protein, partial [Deltaproteobacteria bacterium]|nr:PKD domain-containing protein [Deltaproteobacteria bacterium]
MDVIAACIAGEDPLNVTIDALGGQALEEGNRLTFTGRASQSNVLPRAYTFFWNFGDGSPVQTCTAGPSAPSPSCFVQYTYPDNGSPTVRLTVRNDLGCSAGAARPLQIANKPPVLAAGQPRLLAADVVEGTAFRLGVEYSDPGTADTHTVSWDCDGNGLFEVTGKEGSCLYRADDFPPDDDQENHTVSVKIVDDDGGQVSGTVNVTVRNAPPLVSTPRDLVDGVFEGDPVRFEASASDPGIDPGDSQIAFHWVFEGLGESREQNPTMVFPDNGSYTGRVWATDNGGQGATSVNPATVEVIVQNRPPLAMGCLDVGIAPAAECAQVAAPDLPQRWLSAPPDPQAPPGWCKRDEQTAQAPELTCLRFVALASDPGTVDAQNLQFSWSFGDGNDVAMGGPGENWWVRHSYQNEGKYTVQVTARDPQGRTYTDSLQVQITAETPVCALVEALDEAVECEPVMVQVLATSPDGGALYYTYDWGDGSAEQPSPLALLAHSYPQDGLYTVSVRAEDRQGVGIACPPLELVVANSLPKVLLPESADVVEGQRLALDGLVRDCNADQLTYTWDFGDGTPLEDGTASSEHTYAEPGDYTVSLLVEDDEPLGEGEPPAPDAPNLARMVVHVANLPPDLTILRPAPASGDEGECIEYAACAVDPGGQPHEPIAFSWSWGDGQTTVDRGPEPVRGCEPGGGGGLDPCNLCPGQCSKVLRAYTDNRPENQPFQVQLSARDPQGGERSLPLSMVVHNVAPRVKQPPQYPDVPAFPATAVPGVLLLYQFQPNEPGATDRLLLEWEMVEPPSWRGLGMDLVRRGANAGTFSWTPLVDQVDLAFTVAVRVSDKDGASGSFRGRLVVEAGDSEPDGLPDFYEQQIAAAHPGCLVVGRNDRERDVDGDGLSNVEEYQRDDSGALSNPCVSNAPQAPVPVRPLDGDEEPRGRRTDQPSLDLELVVNKALDADIGAGYEVYADMSSLHYLFVVGKNLS